MQSKLKITETELVKLIIEYLNRHGHMVWRNNTGAIKSQYINRAGLVKSRFFRFSVKGGPDILGVSKKGIFIGIECKVGYNKPTDDQLFFIERAHKAGGYAFVAYCLDDVIKTGL
jgi:hypothetical protein